MTTYLPPTDPNTTIYGVTDGVPGEDVNAATYPDFAFNDMIPEPTIIELALMTRANFSFTLPLETIHYPTIYGQTTQGTVTVSILLDSTPIPDLANISFSTTPASYSVTSPVLVAIGQRLSLDINGGSGTPRNFEYTLACKRS